MVYAALIVFTGVILQKYGLRLFERTLRNLQKYFRRLIQKHPKNKAYIIFLKALIVAIALLAGPETAELALHYFWRRFIKILRVAFYAALLASLFVGGTAALLRWFETLMNFLSPHLNKLSVILMGPTTIALPILFVEKMIKAVCCSLIWGYICVCVQRFQTSKQKIQLVLIISCLSCCFYFILKDFTYLRAASIWLINNSTALHQLVHCQLGRFSLLIGCTVLMRQFVFLPGSPVMFVLLTYGLGVYTLAFNASTNLFPKLK